MNKGDRQMKRITSIFLCFLMLLSAISFQVFADEVDAVQGDTAEGLTNEWYGGLNLVITEDGVDEAVITEDVLAVLEKYLALRELSFNNPEGKADFAIFYREKPRISLQYHEKYGMIWK
jgi:hypothetical protein